MQAELEQIWAHQKILDAKLQIELKILDEKHEADVNVFLHRVTSIQNQYNAFSNCCAHAEESVQILKYILVKRIAPSSSSNNGRNAGNEDNTDASTGRHISIN